MAVLAVALSASACSGAGAEPAPPRAVTPTAVPTSSGTAPSPVVDGPAGDPAAVPRAARAHTFAGAQAFAEFYLAQLNKAWQTPDPSMIASLAMAGCRTCKALMDTARSMKERGQRYDRAPVEVTTSAWQPGSTLNVVNVDVIAKQTPARVLGPSGNVVEERQAQDTTSAVRVGWTARGWRIAEIRLVVTR